MEQMITHTGGCHCRAVAFEVDHAADMVVYECNCSICRMTGFWHLIVPANRFRLLRGQDMLETYCFNTGVARHHFCRRCGIKSFYVPRSNPDGYSVNVRCLDHSTIKSVEVRPFDGQNWERASAKIRHLSAD
jgi:hypothetical protein